MGKKLKKEEKKKNCNSWNLRAAISKLFQVRETLVHIQSCLKSDKSSSASAWNPKMESNTFSQMFIPVPTVTMKEREEEEEYGGGVDKGSEERREKKKKKKKKSFCNSALCVAVRSLCSCNETAGCGAQLLEVI